MQQWQSVEGQNQNATGNSGILGSAPTTLSAPPGFEKRAVQEESSAATAATAGPSGLAIPPGFDTSSSSLSSSSASLAFPPGFGSSSLQPASSRAPPGFAPRQQVVAAGSPEATTASAATTSVAGVAMLNTASAGSAVAAPVAAAAVAAAQEEEPFLSYLPQDEILAGGVCRLGGMVSGSAGGSDGGLVGGSAAGLAGVDSGETQRMVDRTVERLREMLRLPAKQFWRSVARTPSLATFLDSYLRFRSRWFDLLLSAAAAATAAAPTAAAMTTAANSRAVIVAGAEGEDGVGSGGEGSEGSGRGVVVGDEELCRLVFLLLLRMSSNIESKAKPSVQLQAKDHANLLLSMRIFDAPKLMDIAAIFGKANPASTEQLVCRVLVCQPNFRADLSSSLLQLLRVVEEMVARACIVMEKHSKTSSSSPASAEILEALSYLCDFAFSLDSLFDAYPPAPLLLLQATTAATTTKATSARTPAAAAAAPSSGTSHLRLLPVAARIHDSFLPLLFHSVAVNQEAKPSPGQVLGQILQMKLEEVAWKYLWGAFLGGRGCAAASAAAAAAAAAAVAAGAGSTSAKISSNSRSRSRNGSSSHGNGVLPLCPVCDGGVKAGRGKDLGCPLWDGLPWQKANFGQLLVEEVLVAHGASSGRKDVNNDVWVPLLRAVDASFGLRAAIYEEKMKGKLPLDNTQFDTVSDIIGPPITLPPPLSTSITSGSNSSTAPNLPPTAADFPSLTPSLSSTSDAESAALEQSKISLVRDIFPDFGEGFVGACLDVYGGDAEAVIQHVLEGSLHPDLAKLDTQLKVKPGKAGGGGTGDAGTAGYAAAAVAAAGAAGSGGAGAGRVAGKGKGKAAVEEGGEEDEEEEEEGAGGWGGVVAQQKEVERQLKGEGSSAGGGAGGSWAGIARNTAAAAATAGATDPATASATAASSSVGRFVRSKRDEESVEEEVWKRGSAAGTGTRREQEAVKRFVFESQFEYDDEYDDSFDDLEGYDVAAGAGSSEVEEVRTRFDARAAARAAAAAGAGGGAGGGLEASGKKQPYQQEHQGLAEGQSQAQAQAHGPQFYVKDGKNYSYKVKGSVAVGSAAQAAEMKRIEAGLIHGLGEGGNRATWGAPEEEEEEEEEGEEGDEGGGTRGGIGGGGNSTSGVGRGRELSTSPASANTTGSTPPTTGAGASSGSGGGARAGAAAAAGASAGTVVGKKERKPSNKAGPGFGGVSGHR
ncbi:hypothetical protein CLOM_g20312 [Closterium sp. NIES-68]|nr:hypothetical protein CLOM_g20312 [Closterium sp. NIES-68]